MNRNVFSHFNLPCCDAMQTILNFPGYGKGKGKGFTSCVTFKEFKELPKDIGPMPGLPSVINITWQAVALPHSAIITLLTPCNAPSINVLSHSSIIRNLLRMPS